MTTSHSPWMMADQKRIKHERLSCLKKKSSMWLMRLCNSTHGSVRHTIPEATNLILFANEKRKIVFLVSFLILSGHWPTEADGWFCTFLRRSILDCLKKVQSSW